MISTTQDELLDRTEIAPEDRWNVEALFPNFQAWEQTFSRVKGNDRSPHWPQISAFRNRLKDGPHVVKKALEVIHALARELELLHIYAHLRHDEDITLDASKAAFLKISALLHDFQQECSWLEPEFLSLPKETLDSYLRSPELSAYRFYLEKIVYMRPYTLSADKEELLALAGKSQEAPPRAFSALNNADIKFPSVKDKDGKARPLSHGLYQVYLRDADRTLRENAFKELHLKFFEFENTLCELIQGEIQSHLFITKARGYESCLQAALYPKNIPLSVYHALIQSVRKGLGSLHRYVQLRKKILKVPELHLYDMYVPLVAEKAPKMSYEEAEEVVIASTAPLGEEYRELLRKGLKVDRWVDRYENRNKRSGAYSSGSYDTYPYILMNFRENLKDTFTLAHEAGHSMHSLLSNKKQPYHYSHYPIFVAEVASTFNEELLMHHLLQKTKSKGERLFLLNEKIEEIRTTFFRQTLFAEFELKLHEFAENSVPLTPALLKQEFRKLNEDYFGSAVTIDKEIDIEWARIPHFYYNFYVFQYATGISAALNLAEKILNNSKGAKEAYLAFLSGGSSLYPIDLLKLAGVDMTTSAPVDATLRRFDSLVTEFEKLIFS